MNYIFILNSAYIMNTQTLILDQIKLERLYQRLALVRGCSPGSNGQIYCGGQILPGPKAFDRLPATESNEDKLARLRGLWDERKRLLTEIREAMGEGERVKAGELQKQRAEAGRQANNITKELRKAGYRVCDRKARRQRKCSRVGHWYLPR